RRLARLRAGPQLPGRQGFPRTGRSPPARQLVRAEPATTSPAIRGARDAQPASLAEPARVPAFVMVGSLVAEVAARCRAEPGDLCAAIRMALPACRCTVLPIEGVT